MTATAAAPPEADARHQHITTVRNPWKWPVVATAAVDLAAVAGAAAATTLNHRYAGVAQATAAGLFLLLMAFHVLFEANRARPSRRAFNAARAGRRDVA